MYLPNNTLLQGGKYKIVRHISSGGFGNTYEGIHTMMDTHVAIKEFFPKLFCNRDENTSHITVTTQSNREIVDKLRKKFIEEAKAIFKMNHPNIVKVHDVFEENGTAYYVMDYIDGKSLGDIVKQRGALPETEAVDYICQVADALKYVHSLNRLHLDIKPGNIMVDKLGKVKLIDFGASKHYDMESGENTSTLMGLNTKGYAPIEQSTQSFTKFSPATDIYALGATLYKLLSGITPPDANLLMAGEEKLQPLPSDLSRVVCSAVFSAMSYKRSDRPQNIDDFLSILISEQAPVLNDEATIIEKEYIEFVDLGLSVKWGICNIGANFPEDVGSFFAWGETVIKNSYTTNNSQTHSGGIFCSTKKNKSWLICQQFINNDGRMHKSHDAAYISNGSEWRIPTLFEMNELNSKCTWYIGTRKNIPGYKVVGPNGNSIFLPCTGRKDGSRLIDKYTGAYQTSMVPDDDSSANFAWALFFDDKGHGMKGIKRYMGTVIRPVKN